jgi:hypothetical protein
MLSLLAETGFDRSRTMEGFLFIVVVTVAMLIFIGVGAAYMRDQELKARRMREDSKKGPSGDDENT